MSKIKLSENFIRNTVKLALNEDLFPSGDITSNLVENNKIIKVKLMSNQDAIIGGLLFAKHAFSLVDKKIKFLIKKKDGSFVKKKVINCYSTRKSTKYISCRESCFKLFVSYFRNCN